MVGAIHSAGNRREPAAASGRAAARVAARLTAAFAANWIALGGAALADAAPTPVVKVTVPAEAPGDGATVITLTVVADPAVVSSAGDLAVEVNGGTARAAQATAPGRFVVELVPPLVAVPATLQVTVRFARASQAEARVRLTPPGAGSAEVVSRGPLDLRGPAHLLAGGTAAATISFRAGPGAPPTLRASRGTLGVPEPAAGGRWRARYVPPSARYPQVAVIAATDPRGGLTEWIAIPILGLADVDTRTKPGAMVTSRVAGATYGPWRAGRDGRVRQTVAVPPGVTAGLTVAQDRAGNTKETPLDLAPPPLERVAAFCDTDGEALTLVVVDAAGRPRDERPDVTATRGTLTAPERVAPGVYRARHSPAAGVRAGDPLELGGRVAGGGRAATCAVRYPGAWPTGLEVRLGSPEHRAGSGVPITVEVVAITPAEGAARPLRLELSADRGTLSPPQPLDGGRYVARWELPDHHDGRGRATVRASVAGRAALAGAASVALLPAAPARVRVTAAASSLRADGVSSTEVAARALDAYDNPVPGVAFAGTGRGSLGPFRPTADGAVVAVYRSPLLRDGGRDQLTVRGEGSDLEGTLALELQPAPRRFGLTLRGGYLNNFGKVSAPTGALAAETRLPWLGRRLLVGIEAGYFGSSSHRLDAAGVETVTASVRGLPLLARLSYELPLRRFSFSVGACAGVAFVHTGVTSPSAGSTVRDDVVGAYGGFAGLGLRVPRGRILVEVGYLYAAVDNAVATGNAAGLGVSAGYRLEL